MEKFLSFLVIAENIFLSKAQDLVNYGQERSFSLYNVFPKFPLRRARFYGFEEHN